MSVQSGAVASQKLTWPGVTGDVPARVVAVSVTTVPVGTAVTGEPAAVMARVVVVAGLAVMLTLMELELLLAYTVSPG